MTSFEGLGGLSGYLSLEAFRLQTEGTTADADLSNDAFGWGGRVNASYGLGDRVGLGGLDLQATARYSAPLDTEQGRVGARTFVDLALRQKLLDDRASLTLQLRDPLGLAGFSYTLDQADLFQRFERDWGAQQVGLTFSYQFGRQESRRERGGERGWRRRLRGRGVLAAAPPEPRPRGAVHAPPTPPRPWLCLVPQKIGLWVGVAVVAAALLVLPRFVGGEAEAEAPSEGGRGGGDTLAVTVAPVSQELLEDRVTTTGDAPPVGGRRPPRRGRGPRDGGWALARAALSARGRRSCRSTRRSSKPRSKAPGRAATSPRCRRSVGASCSRSAASAGKPSTRPRARPASSTPSWPSSRPRSAAAGSSPRSRGRSGSAR